DNCPGFGSVAKYVAVSIDEAELDIASMCETSTKVFIMEVMGRHAGWIVSACGLGNHSASRAKNRILLFPEIPFDTERFLKNVQAQVDEQGYAVIGASEGTADKNGTFLAQSGQKDSFGHNQLGGVAPYLAQLIQQRLELKCHWAVADYLQRSARHLVSATDLQQAKAVGEAALRMAMDKQSGFMPVITRTSNNPYSWRIDSAPIAGTANVEKKLPRHYITEDGYNITDDGRQYLQPLISGEAWPAYLDGLPKRTPLKLEYIKKKLSHFTL
ncbi:MAG: diphosphate--fructose-6-phosphate 1-phosphotransferase, partial [Gammaproteobacteria bacterium]